MAEIRQKTKSLVTWTKPVNFSGDCLPVRKGPSRRPRFGRRLPVAGCRLPATGNRAGRAPSIPLRQLDQPAFNRHRNSFRPSGSVQLPKY